MSLAQRRGMVDREHLLLSIARQCALLGVARSSLDYRPREASGENLCHRRCKPWTGSTWKHPSTGRDA